MSATKVLIRRWETSGGKHWYELREDALGFTYAGDNCGGNLGDITLPAALDRMERMIADAREIDGIAYRAVPSARRPD